MRYFLIKRLFEHYYEKVLEIRQKQPFTDLDFQLYQSINCKTSSKTVLHRIKMSKIKLGAIGVLLIDSTDSYF